VNQDQYGMCRIVEPYVHHFVKANRSSGFFVSESERWAPQQLPCHLSCAYSSCMHDHYYPFNAALQLHHALLFWQQTPPRIRVQLKMPVARHAAMFCYTGQMSTGMMTDGS